MRKSRKGQQAHVLYGPTRGRSLGACRGSVERANLSALLLSCIAQKALGLPSWQTRSAHAPRPCFARPVQHVCLLTMRATASVGR